ncbi:MAG: 2-hydroxychromene-2-carboxylate isomerase, partial [bacterium]|nr:2-hydroxychromene-2-carboxylate isomerase [bacterium]
MKEIEYFYSAHSGFAYLGSKRFMEIAGAAGRKVVHRPFDLNKLLTEIGAPSFRTRSAVHRDYFFRREIERWSEYRGAPWIEKRPTYHDNDFTHANRMIMAAAEENRANPLAHAFLEAHWREDADLSDKRSLIGLADGLGMN